MNINISLLPADRFKNGFGFTEITTQKDLCDKILNRKHKMSLKILLFSSEYLINFSSQFIFLHYVKKNCLETLHNTFSSILYYMYLTIFFVVSHRRHLKSKKLNF